MNLEKNGPWLEVRVPKKAAGRTVAAVLAMEAGLPERVTEELFRSGQVMKNKEVTSPHEEVKQGDRLRCLLFPEEPYGVPPEMLPLDVLYEDDHLLVVNKRAGVKVHPNSPDETDTLMNAIAFHYQMQGLEARVRQLHRLDQETSGAILFPKHAIAQKLLDEMLTSRTISREYWAVVKGKVERDAGLIDEPIGRDRYHATRRRVSRTGKPAQTEYAVLERLRGATLVRAKLRTGRTHQIRVHLAHIGHPLLGDDLYGGPMDKIGRQALHAAFLRFPHPLSGEPLEIEAPLPDDMANLFDRLRG
ncbi:MAG: RluA family pseudouridine synthase [Tumebacillaceae bacterium]